MKKIGVVEGFFGPQWKMIDRTSYASFLAQFGGDFYIYAPKQDQCLRRLWREPWGEDYVERLGSLAKVFHEAGIKFGVGLSPFGLGPLLTEVEKTNLGEKLSILSRIKIDILGLFFDDMPVEANLAKTQIQALDFIRQNFEKEIVFCPSFYTFDPILEKVFGPRPHHYFEEIAMGVSPEVSMAWTGPKVISSVIDQEHLIEVSQLLKRKPFIWENLYANDGPKNCKFLKLIPFSGRDQDILSHIEAIGFNLMNQAQLSKILYLSSKYVLDGNEPFQAFENALSALCTLEFKTVMLKNRDLFVLEGLDKIGTELRSALINDLQSMEDLAAKEVMEWLQGVYLVTTECLTD